MLNIIKFVLDRAGGSNDIVFSLNVFAAGLLSLIVYCCANRSIFRLCICAIMVINTLMLIF